MSEVAAEGEEFRDDPAVPHYRLAALHRLLQAKGALAGAEVRDLGTTLGIVFAARAPRVATQPART